MSPTLVCVTGLDGAGKSTVIADVVERLNSRGARRAVKIAGVPRAAQVAGTPRAIKVAVWDAFLECPPSRPAPFRSRSAVDRYVADLGPTSRVLVLLHSFYEALALAARKNAALCVVDGYWYKHCATEVALGGNLEEILRLATVLPEPQHLFYLRVDAAVAAARKTTIAAYETGFAPARSKESFIAFQRKADAVLRPLVRARGAVELDGHAPVATSADAILAALENAGAITLPATRAS